MSDYGTPEHFDALAAMAEDVGLSVLAADYRRLRDERRHQRGMDDLLEEINQQQTIADLEAGKVYTAPANTEPEHAEWTEIGAWIDETHLWAASSEDPAHQGHNLATQAHHYSHITITGQDGNTLSKFIGEPAPPPPQIAPPYKGLREAIDRHYDRYLIHPRQGFKAGGYLP